MSNIPIHEPVGNDTENWTTLSNKEAHIRAKAIEKGHMPHDWRWAANKVFKTDKFYPPELRGDPLEKAPDTVDGNSDFQNERQTDLPRDTRRDENTNVAGPTSTPHAFESQNQSGTTGYDGASGPLQSTTQSGRGLEHEGDRLQAPNDDDGWRSREDQ